MRRSSSRNNLAPLVSVLGLSSLLVAACGDAGGNCTGGAEGCACVERECLGDLVCSTQDVCVDPGGGSTGVTMVGSGTDTAASGGGETDGGSAGGKGGDETDGGSGGDNGRCAENSPPEIVDVNVQGSAIAAREDLRVTITVADPDGLDDVAGARLELPDGSEFKSMGKVSQDSFVAEPDWYYDVGYYGIGDEIPLDTLIEFQIAVDDGCDTTRTPLPLIVCGGDGDSLCDGECRDTDYNEQSCGSCDNACDEGEYCDYGSCYMDYAAVPEDAEASGASHPISLPRDHVPLSFGAATPAHERVDVTGFAL